MVDEDAIHCYNIVFDAGCAVRGAGCAVADVAGNVDEWPEPGNGRVSRALSIDRRDFKPQWNRLRIVKRGVGDIEVGLSYSREYTKFTIRIR